MRTAVLKPNPRYYADILAEIGLRGEDCLMVGNDTKEDLVAAELGFDTFLLEGYLSTGVLPILPPGGETGQTSWKCWSGDEYGKTRPDLAGQELSAPPPPRSWPGS